MGTRTFFPFLKSYFFNPVHAIKIVPELNWSILVPIQIILIGIANCMASSFENMGLKTAYALIAQYFLLLFLQQCLFLLQNFRARLNQLMSLIIFSQVPYLVLHPFSHWIPPIDLIGFAGACILLAVGLSENFECSKKFSLRCSGLVYLCFTLIWSWSLITQHP